MNLVDLLELVEWPRWIVLTWAYPAKTQPESKLVITLITSNTGLFFFNETMEENV